MMSFDEPTIGAEAILILSPEPAAQGTGKLTEKKETAETARY